MFRSVAGDTEVAPYDGGSQGNRTLQGTGRAVEAAARECLQQILAAAGPLLDNAAPADLEMRDAVIRVKAQPARSVKLAEVMQRRGRSVVGIGSTTAPQTGMDVERTTAAHFVEVEVDRETGKVRILRYIAAHDVGRPINVTIVENQIEGGTIQGLALTQGEEMRFDSRTGGCLIGQLRRSEAADDARLRSARDRGGHRAERRRRRSVRGQGARRESLSPGDGCRGQRHLQRDRRSPARGAVHPRQSSCARLNEQRPAASPDA